MTFLNLYILSIYGTRTGSILNLDANGSLRISDCHFFRHLLYMTMSMSVQVISTARTCNCILIVLDAIKPITHKRLIEKELEGFGIRFFSPKLFIIYFCACDISILFLKNQMVPGL